MTCVNCPPCEWGTFAYGEQVYGACSQYISFASFISDSTIRVQFTDEFVTDATFYAAANVLVEGLNGADNLVVRQVLSFNDTVLATNYMLINVGLATEGSYYRVTLTNLSLRDGTIIANQEVELPYLRTKTDSMIRGLPSHYDNRPQSNLSKLLIAISTSDQAIGGTGTRRIL